MLAIAVLCGAAAQAQQTTELSQILLRLEKLEQQNMELMEEVRALREELAKTRSQPAAEAAPAAQPAAGPTLEERVEVQETRTADLAQSKVEASRHFPIRLTGMVLFNGFYNSATVGQEYPVTALPGQDRAAGATFRQTLLGLDYSGPQTLAGGKVRGSLYMDFFGGSGNTLDQLVRLRTAVVGIDWKTRSVEAGLEKPLISPREPDSLAQVGVSPLTGAGNLWLWIPQVRFEQRFDLGGQMRLRAQASVIQTSESAPTATPGYGGFAAYASGEIEPRRPGIEGRLEFSAGGENRRLELAPGFHRSVSHIADSRVPSNIVSADWLARPWSPFELTGAFFSGQNVSALGGGGLPGFTVVPWQRIIAVHSRGGWLQASLQATSRLTFHAFGGEQDNRGADLVAGEIARNLQWGGNLFYRLAPNVILALEASQLRTSLAASGTRLNNHYDLALAYLF